MGKGDTNSELRWIKEQVRKYRAVSGRYETYADVLEGVLGAAARKYAPQAVVQVRAKSVSSFAEKLQRKRTPRKDPVNEFTDLCGGRVIATVPSEVAALCKFIERHFEIDWENSIDVGQRHKPAEFGYRSVHYIVQFKKGVFPTDDIDVKVPPTVLPGDGCPMKAEVQVRTLLEHAWAVFAHDRTYKSSFRMPADLERELAAQAALLEDADRSFERIQDRLKAYASNYRAYMTPDEIAGEIGKLEFVLSHAPGDLGLAARIGQMAIAMGDWRKAIDVLAPFAESKNRDALKLLGVATCKSHRGNAESKGLARGRKYLESAIALDDRDVDAIASLAGTWKGVDEERAGELYRKAFEIDPVDPYALENYLTYETLKAKDRSVATAMAPVVDLSIARCREQAAAGINIPWAWYGMGKFHLLLGRPYASMDAYSRAINLSTSEDMISTSLESIEKLSAVKGGLVGYEWIRRLLLLGAASKFKSKGAMKKLERLSTKGAEGLKGPIVIVAGGCDSSVEKAMCGYRDVLLGAFQDFRGTVISGGTTQGISGLAGELGKRHAGAIHTIGYLPRLVPADATVDKDPVRYKEIRYTDGEGFTPIEPLQNWVDILSSGIGLGEVKVLGINGGRISAIEYKVALALGAQVALIEDSGREASRLLTDEDWAGTRLMPVPADAQTIRAFIGSGRSKLAPEKRDAMARAFQETYREMHKDDALKKDPSMAGWDDLREGFRESNRQAADHVSEKLRQIGCEVHEAKGGKPALFKFTDREVETMAEMEHGRWNAERLADGWRWAEEKDVDKKLSPYLVGWGELPEGVKEWDRQMVRDIPKVLARVGLEIRRAKRR